MWLTNNHPQRVYLLLLIGRGHSSSSDHVHTSSPSTCCPLDQTTHPISCKSNTLNSQWYLYTGHIGTVKFAQCPSVKLDFILYTVMTDILPEANVRGYFKRKIWRQKAITIHTVPKYFEQCNMSDSKPTRWTENNHGIFHHLLNACIVSRNRTYRQTN